MKFSDNIESIKGIGKKTGEAYNKKGIYNIKDLLEYFPRDYDYFQDIININEAEEGKVAAFYVSLSVKPKMNGRSPLKTITVTLRDATGVLPAVWFRTPYLFNQLKMGVRYIFRGRVERYKGRLCLMQAKMYSKQDFYKNCNKLFPIYPMIKGISNQAIAKSIRYALDEMEAIPETLFMSFRKKYSLISYKKALKQIHFPNHAKEYIEARNRLVFDELFHYQLMLRKLSGEVNVVKSPYPLAVPKECNNCIENLPFSLTKAQSDVWKEICADVNSGKIMNRLIQGDVGCGKTIIAQLALLMTVKNGYQGCIMVPTEVLAKQHYESFKKLLDPYLIKIDILVGSQTAKQKELLYEKIESGEIDIVIGTHALIQEKVKYKNLAMVITDEQHRFGVRQREELFKKGEKPHIIVMSATPIPRTLAMILYGNMDISVIDSLPGERLPIKNCVVGTEYRPQAYEFIKKQVEEGRQAYIICPLVEESETSEAENVTDYKERLKDYIPNNICIETLHGKMKAIQKNDIMNRFFNNEISILVSTTVIEVGINVVNASVILIENAERFGLAALHQLRGRVGRGSHQSYCILMSSSRTKESRERLEILNQSNDGFFIAKKDLEMRGQGDLFGIRQSGDLDFKLADVFRDSNLLKQAHEAAINFDLKKIEHLEDLTRLYF